MAEITGPITGGSKGRVFAGPTSDLAAHGYQEKEYFLEGTAMRYRPRGGTELGVDGRWAVEAGGTSAFKTRVAVYHPIDPQSFNGTVLVCWNNVSAGFDGYNVDSPAILESGFAYAAVTAQRAGVHGMGEHPMGLVQWDPERYGSLSIESDDYSYDIFTQAARLVGTDRPRSPIDPLEGLDVRRVVAIGGSQSAGRLATYINAVQPLEGVFDAFMPFLYFGAGSPLEVGPYVFNPAAPGERPRLPGVPSRLRGDIDARIMIVNSELEAIACYPVRQPDTDRFRNWEAAGTAHVSAQSMRARAEAIKGDVDAPAMDFSGINEVPLNPIIEAAYQHLQTWVETGTPPPSQPRIEFAGQPPEVVRDDNGIARGGIRLPQVEVPLATNSAVAEPNSVMGFLGGSCVPFPPEKVRALYGDADSYLGRFEQATLAVEKSGAILPQGVEPLIVEAREAFEKAIGGS
jgi:hypothetical protein